MRNCQEKNQLIILNIIQQSLNCQALDDKEIHNWRLKFKASSQAYDDLDSCTKNTCQTYFNLITFIILNRLSEG
ncbi:unnamed protein product [Paramecium octaurelia]|uniref:Uncharacterized protein n=1 Tax=Paramecium octaurelia TaxID=43137 RepID=A0A8S1WYG3_PAROT|nr:unnamed protein product [Paramecium octaurelia]